MQRMFVAVFVLTLTITGCSRENGEAERKLAEEGARTKRFKQLLDSGKSALEAGQFDEAVKHCEEAVRLQNFAEAIELLQQARKVRDEARKAQFDMAMLRGRRALQEKNHDAASTSFRDALIQIPDNKEAAAALKEAEFHGFMEKGQTAFENHQYKQASQFFGEALKRQPEDSLGQDLAKQARGQWRQQTMEHGKATLAAKKYLEAVQLFTEAKDLCSDAELTELLSEATFWMNLQIGRQRVEAKQFGSALPNLKEALRIKRDHAEALDLRKKAVDGKRRQDKIDYDRIELRRQSVKHTIDSTRSQIQSVDGEIRILKIRLSATPAKQQGMRFGIDAQIRSAESRRQQLSSTLTSNESELRRLEGQLATLRYALNSPH